MRISDLLHTLREEIVLARPDMQSWLTAVAQAAPGCGPFEEALHAYAGQIARMADTCEMLGLGGLQRFLVHLHAASGHLAGMPERSRRVACEAHGEAIQAVLDYLAEPDEPRAVRRMLGMLAEGRTGLAPSVTALTALEAAFDAGVALPEEFLDAMTAPKPIVSGEDMALELPADIDRGIFDAFMADAPDQAATLSRRLAAYLAAPDAAEERREACRIAHSFKGSANIIGLTGLGTLAHRLEDVLDALAEQPAGTPIPPALADTMLDATAAMEQMVGSLQGTDEAPANAAAIAQALVDWVYAREDMASDPAAGGPFAAATAAAQAALEDAAGRTEDALGVGTIDVALAHEPIDRLAPPSLSLPGEAAAGAQAAPRQREEEGSLRVAAQSVDDMLRLVGELNTKIAQLQTQVRQTQGRQRQLLNQNRIVQARLADLDRAVAVRGVSLEMGRAHGQTLDPLELDRYNEMYGATHALMEANADFNELGHAIDGDLAQLNAESLAQERLGKDLQYRVMSMRMLPVSTLIPRLQRVVRQTGRSTGKEAELSIAGADILVDADVLQQMAEPLLHVLRNAVDHGIESADMRLLKGKPATGHINLRFAREGSAITVTCRDDGRGLNYEKIRAKAAEQGLVDKEAALSHDQLARFILLPGFSTRDTVTEVSGRGVGMDVVLTRIQQLGGTVDVHSPAGQGTEVRLRFQSSLVIQFVLLVQAVDETFALPSGTVAMALAAGSGHIDLGEADTEPGEGRASFEYGGRRYRLRALAERLGVLGDPADRRQWHDRPILIVRGHQGEEALVVDAVADSRDVLLKPLGRYLEGLPGVLGVAILGDGSVAPVLDVPQLLRDEAVYRRMLQIKVARDPRRASVLVVDDSLSVRRSLSQLLEDAGYEVRTAKDGQDALTSLRTTLPDLVLTDLEMPNMNGLELTAQLRARPDTARVPVVMITSRSMDKHRQLAIQAGVDEYVTKPYTDDRLLDAVAAILNAHA
jgi:chemotaxis protein histidine kinase CheA/CheY-like chemotaxis protein